MARLWEGEDRERLRRSGNSSYYSKEVNIKRFIKKTNFKQNMTICIGLIPNEKTVMLIQDSEISYRAVGLTQDIANKIKRISDDAVMGIIGNPFAANEMFALVPSKNYSQWRELKETVEEAYHAVREDKLLKSVLRKYGFRNIREVTQPPKETAIDSTVREEILRTAQDQSNELGINLMLASNIERPQLYNVVFPGVGWLESQVKMYSVNGSGTIMALDKMGEELARYKWQPQLSIDEGIDVLLRAGKASEKHVGVGGPFEIAYVTKGEDGKNRVINPDPKKINMVIYLFPYGVDERIMMEAITRMRDDQVTAAELADYIKSNTQVGIEFDHYFKL